MARAAGPQGTSAPGALLLRRQPRVTRASTEGALRFGSPSTLRGPSLLRRRFQSRLRPGLGLGMAAPLRLVVPSVTSSFLSGTMASRLDYPSWLAIFF